MGPLSRKVLIISHVPIDSTYGAATSLRGHLQALASQDVYRLGLFLPKSIPRGKDTQMSDAEIIKTFPSVLDVRHFYMMYRLNYHWSNHGVIVLFYNRVRNYVSLLTRAKMIQTIKEFRPDLIHLNSLVLSPIALWVKRDKELGSVPVLSHVRELLRPTLSVQAKREIAAVDTFTCIDLAARNQLLSVMDRMIRGKEVSIVQNPFRSNDRNPDLDIFKDIDSQSLKVFAIAGQVSAEKGVKFVCEAFVKANLDKSVLLVLGRARGTYARTLRALCDDYPSKLRWLGEQPNLLGRGFFNGIDAIVRGDATYCTGRTVYEALFSGAGALLPGTQADLNSDPNLLPFQNEIIMYEPNNLQALTRAFQTYAAKHFNRQSTVAKNRKPLSNFQIYSQLILDCYNKALQ
jgi:hypothetical protein